VPPSPPVAALVAAVAPPTSSPLPAAAVVSPLPQPPWPVAADVPPALAWSWLPGVPLPYAYRRASRGRAHRVRGMSCTRASSTRAHVLCRIGALCIMYMVHITSLCLY
jgi:hypothetical protein